MSGTTTRTPTNAAETTTQASPPPAPLPTAAGEQHHPNAGEPVRAQPAERGPTANCTADSAGGLTFDVRLPAGVSHGTDAGLLLRRRPDPSGETEEVRLPLAPVQEAADGTLRAALPSTVRLGEGRWNVFLLLAGQQPRRLAPGINDLRSLVDRVPHESRTWLGVRIPYATKHGNLSVRSWMRWPHAEAGALCVHDGGLELTGRLYGAEVKPTARLEARPRRGEATAPVLVEVAPSAADPREFTVTLAYPALAAHRLWDLWLRPDDGAEAVRVARILDDVADKKRIFTYPAQAVEVAAAAGEEPALTAKPYYTLNNDLAVRVDRTEP
ncbi:hypothetical protein ABZ820_39600 [Streptomyces diacarni]|uniref:hypothetical protein n=1 Tax=Streptomyces diacarni TaxID=2800381 RepID=UPI0034035575